MGRAKAEQPMTEAQIRAELEALHRQCKTLAGDRDPMAQVALAQKRKQIGKLEARLLNPTPSPEPSPQPPPPPWSLDALEAQRKADQDEPAAPRPAPAEPEPEPGPEPIDLGPVEIGIREEDEEKEPAPAPTANAAPTSQVRRYRKILTTVYLNPEQDHGLRVLSEQTGVPVAALIRRGIDAVLAEPDLGAPRVAPRGSRVTELERCLEWVSGRLAGVRPHLPAITDKADLAGLDEMARRIALALGRA